MKDNIEFVKDQLIKNFSALPSLSEMGYVIDSCETTFSSTSNSDAALLVVSSKEIDRCLKFFLSPSKDFLGIIMVEITYPKHNQSFYLHDWIMKHSEAGWGNKFQLRHYSSDFEKAVEGFFSFFKSLIDDPKLKKVISGQRWENVEFNWGGMK